MPVHRHSRLRRYRPRRQARRRRRVHDDRLDLAADLATGPVPEGVRPDRHQTGPARRRAGRAGEGRLQRRRVVRPAREPGDERHPSLRRGCHRRALRRQPARRPRLRPRRWLDDGRPADAHDLEVPQPFRRAAAGVHARLGAGPVLGADQGLAPGEQAGVAVQGQGEVGHAAARSGRAADARPGFVRPRRRSRHPASRAPRPAAVSAPRPCSAAIRFRLHRSRPARPSSRTARSTA